MFWAVWTSFCLLIAPAAKGGEVVEDQARIAPDGQRFLFVVETSSDNKKFEANNRQAVFDLILSGVNGHMRDGDTFGLWTFSDEVRAGDFPMTVWEKDSAMELAGRAAGFLQKQKYSKDPNLRALVTSLRQLSDRAADFNVFIVSSGREPMAGTPFDENINAAYKAFVRTSSKTGRPLVTGFVVRNAKPVRASVVLAGDSIVMPVRPPSLARKPSTPKPPATDASAATMVAGAGAAPATNRTPATATASATGVEPPRKKVIQIVTRTNPPAAQLTASTTPTSTPGAAPGESSPSPTGPAPGPAPAPAVIATATSATPTMPPAATTPQTSLAPTSSASAAAASTASTPPAQAPAIAVATAPTSPSTAPAPASVAGPGAAVAVTKTSPPTAVEAGSSKPGLLAAASAALNPPPMTVAARERTPGQGEGDSAGVIPLSPTTRAGDPPAALQGAILAAPTPTPQGLSAWVLLAMGGILMGAAAFLTVVVLKRLPHPSARGSLITQSMQKDAKRPS